MGIWTQSPAANYPGGGDEGTVALSQKAWVEPSKVEALPHRRHQKALEPLDRAPDRLRLSARVEAHRTGNPSMQQRGAGRRPADPARLAWGVELHHHVRRGMTTSQPFTSFRRVSFCAGRPTFVPADQQPWSLQRQHTKVSSARAVWVIG